MKELRSQCKKFIAQQLQNLAVQKNIELALTEDDIVIEIPPDSTLGDWGIPLFTFAKKFRTSPAKIAQELQENISATEIQYKAVGPYLNLFLNKEKLMQQTLTKIHKQKETYGRNDLFDNEKIMVEFSGPNANKPLHLGHLRNDALGESLSRILVNCGADLKRVNIINDRGIHICKSMLAYQKFGKGETPQSENMKSDHFVGKYYVKFNTWSQEDSTAETQAQEMLRDWEAGNKEVLELWQTMTHWAVDGIKQSYIDTNIHFDTYYFESQTYKLGKDIVLDGLKKDIFTKNDDGAVVLDMSEINLDTKVLLRSDGSSLYMTQDIGTAVERHKDFDFDRLIYVVANEQDYHFQVLFYALQKLGYSWAKNLHHLSYGMVNLPDGKMKSREGTVIDADDLLQSLTSIAAKNIRDRGREPQNDVDKKIALGALHYYLLQSLAHKDMLFDSTESLSFTGNTGPYLQYTGARICSVERKADALDFSVIDYSLLQDDAEWEIIKELAAFPLIVEQAGMEYSPQIITNYLYRLAKKFSQYYTYQSIWEAEKPALSQTRLLLAVSIKQVLKNGLYLLNIPFLEEM